MADRWVRRLAVTGGVVLLIELTVGSALYIAGLRYRFVQVPSLQNLVVRPLRPSALFEANLAHQPWRTAPSAWDRYVGALRWTMNQVRVVGRSNHTQDAEALLRFVQDGGGALCSDMTVLFRSSLSAVGLPSRTVWIFTEPSGGNSHSTVEVLVRGKWVILDPTFGVYFRDSAGTMLSAQDIKEKLFTGDYRDIEPVFVGGTAYPARLGNYYMNWLPLFSYVFVLRNGGAAPWLARLPPFRYWWGQRFYLQRTRAESMQHLAVLQHLYFVFVVVIPSVLIALTLAIATRLGMRRFGQLEVMQQRSPRL